MKLFDLHCDTPYEIAHKRVSLTQNDLHISLDKTSPYSAYIQSAAIWSDCRLSEEEAWQEYLRICEHFAREAETCPNAFIGHTADDIRRALNTGERCFIPAVEDARILAGDLTRLDILKKNGVRFLTLTWAGKSCIGGSHDTDKPLTDFGRAVVDKCFDLHIIPDVSHASRAVTAEVLQMAKECGKPVIATHSNAYSVHPHTRNLTDEEFLGIVRCGGIVGISLCPEHLCAGDCGIDTVADHIRHYIRLGGENAVCLGCDFDGIGETPDGLMNVSCLVHLADQMNTSGIPARIIDKLFFDNAYGFAVENFQ